MATFFFDIDGADDGEDDGLDLRDVESALAAALQAFPDMLRDRALFADQRRFSLTVWNHHAPLFRLSLDLLPSGVNVDEDGDVTPERSMNATSRMRTSGTPSKDNIAMQSDDELIDEVAKKHGVGSDAVSAALTALRRGNGTMAQFSHADFGGMAQWSKGGMSMIGDMFNTRLKARFDSVMTDLAAALETGVGHLERHHGDDDTRSTRSTPDTAHGQWPEEFGAPSSSGGQNDARYAFFPKVQRLIVEDGGKRTIYDTGSHMISGVSQQQSHSRSLKFQSQDGDVRLDELTVVG